MENDAKKISFVLPEDFEALLNEAGARFVCRSQSELVRMLISAGLSEAKDREPEDSEARSEEQGETRGEEPECREDGGG